MNVHIIIKMISIAFKKTKTGFHPMRIKKKKKKRVEQINLFDLTSLINYKFIPIAQGI